MRRDVTLPFITAVFTLTSILINLPAIAADPVEAQLTAKKVVVDKKGHEHFQSGTLAKPGDVLEYKVVYKNKGDTAVSNLIAILPIPVGTEYLDKSAYPDGAEASTNGQEFAPVPLVRSKRTHKLLQLAERKNSVVFEERVPMVEYRTLRWNFPKLSPGVSAIVHARAAITTPNPVPK